VDGLLTYLVDRSQVSAHGDRLFRLLGDRYFEASRYRDAVRSFAAGVDDYPDSALCLQLERSIIQALLILRDHGAANERRESWVQRYSPGSGWDRVHGSGRLARERDALVEEGLRLAALYHHSEAQAGRGTLEPALRLYAGYLERFGLASADGYEMGYGYAQVLTDAGRRVEAAAQYRKIATHADWSAHREDASYRLIEVLTTAHGRGLVSLEDLVAAHEAYAALNPDSVLVPEILFAEGELLFGAGRFGAAREVFERVAEDYAGHELAVKALEHVARCHFQEEAFAQTEEAARRALEARPGADATGRVHKLLAYSIFKQAEEKETAGDREGANHDFFRLAEELPEEEAASIALYRAAENLRALDREGEAAVIYDRLARNYPGSQHAQNALVLSAQIFASLGNWSKAARGYEDVYRLAPGEPGAADALFLAAGARERAAEPLDAIGLLGEFCKRFPSDPRVAKARFTEGGLLRSLGRGDEAAERYRAAWKSRAPENESVYRAMAALELGKLSLAAFREVGLTGDLGRALARKEALLEKALSALAQAASLPFAETLTEALYIAGEAFEHMKEALLTSERPAELTEEEREEYDFLLEEKAFPLEERAISYYRQGVTRARDAGVHTVWVERMFQRLETILPWAYQRAEEPSVAWEVPGLPPPRGGEAAP
jgi:TolA-binding protein